MSIEFKTPEGTTIRIDTEYQCMEFHAPVGFLWSNGLRTVGFPLDSELRTLHAEAIKTIIQSPLLKSNNG